MARLNKEDKFWRDNFMKVLNCLYFEEACWGLKYWEDYGVSHSAKQRIEREFEKWQKDTKIKGNVPVDRILPAAFTNKNGKNTKNRY